MSCGAACQNRSWRPVRRRRRSSFDAEASFAGMSRRSKSGVVRANLLSLIRMMSSASAAMSGTGGTGTGTGCGAGGVAGAGIGVCGAPAGTAGGCPGFGSSIAGGRRSRPSPWGSSSCVWSAAGAAGGSRPGGRSIRARRRRLACERCPRSVMCPRTTRQKRLFSGQRWRSSVSFQWKSSS